jgi:hypothetical protein
VEGKKNSFEFGITRLLFEMKQHRFVKKRTKKNTIRKRSRGKKNKQSKEEKERKKKSFNLLCYSTCAEQNRVE